MVLITRTLVAVVSLALLATGCAANESDPVNLPMVETGEEEVVEVETTSPSTSIVEPESAIHEDCTLGDEAWTEAAEALPEASDKERAEYVLTLCSQTAEEQLESFLGNADLDAWNACVERKEADYEAAYAAEAAGEVDSYVEYLADLGHPINAETGYPSQDGFYIGVCGLEEKDMMMTWGDR